MKKVFYPVLLDMNDTGGWGASFPDFPGVIAAGDTARSAITNAGEALSFHIEAMVADGDRIPAPSLVEAVSYDPEWAMLFMHSVEVPEAQPSLGVVVFQGREFPILSVDGGLSAKVMYLNRTRNIAGSVQARDVSRFPVLLYTQARCCRDDADGQDELEPRP